MSDESFEYLIAAVIAMIRATPDQGEWKIAVPHQAYWWVERHLSWLNHKLHREFDCFYIYELENTYPHYLTIKKLREDHLANKPTQFNRNGMRVRGRSID